MLRGTTPTRYLLYSTYLGHLHIWNTEYHSDHGLAHEHGGC